MDKAAAATLAVVLEHHQRRIPLPSLQPVARNAAAHACGFAPHQGHFFGLETGTYGHRRVRVGALDAQIGKSARKPRSWLVPKHPDRFRPRFGSFRSPWCCLWPRSSKICKMAPKYFFRLSPL